MTVKTPMMDISQMQSDKNSPARNSHYNNPLFYGHPSLTDKFFYSILMDKQGERFPCVAEAKDQSSSHEKEKIAKFDYSEYKSEEIRLNSFNAWPTHYPVNPSRLAKSGFFSLGNGDEVICFSCGGRISHWQFGDIVQKKHKELFPSCDFINNKSDNIPFRQSKTNIDMNSISNSLSSTHLITDTKAKRFENNLPNLSESQHSIQTSEFCEQMFPSHNSDGTMNNSIKPTTSENTLGPIPNFEKLMLEKERLKTFHCGWPLPYLNSRELAKAGFFYLGYKDKVQCAFCHGIVSNWETNDVPIVEHSRHFPFCKFVQQYPSNELEDLNLLDSEKGQDICGNSDYSTQTVISDTYKLIDKSQQHTRLEELGVRIYSGPIHPQQATFHARMRSYSAWPENIPVQKEDLAAAGFFYVGINDHTKCFHCDGGLCCWEEGDDPWVEHARWFRNCSFLHLNKGEDFIQACLNKPPKTSYSEKNSSPHQKNLYESAVTDDLMQKVDDCMQSSLIDAITKTRIFSVNLIKAAVTKQLQEHDCPFSKVDEICEAISLLQGNPPSGIKGKNELPKNISTTKERLSPDNQTSPTKGDVKHILEKNGYESSKLEKENSYLKDQRLCKVCMDHDVNIVFLPCGHLLTCTLCAPSLKDCPGCRKIIQATVRVYLP